MATEKLYDIWARRNPDFECKYEEKIFRTFSDYGKGSSRYQESRGKIFGAGYEVYIMAFFIGLYNGKRKPLTENKDLKKALGQPLQYWGNQEKRRFRKSYGRIREYIFTALVARTDVDFIELDKDKIKPRKVVDMLIQTMEEYANWGLNYIDDKLDENPGYFFRETAFLDIFLSFLERDTDKEEISEDDEPESLD